MIIPYHMLAADTLTNLVIEFVSRDGTDNGYERSLSSKIDAVISLLKTGKAVIYFDKETQMTNIILT